MRYLSLLFKSLVALCLGAFALILITLISIRLLTQPKQWISPLTVFLAKHHLEIMVDSLDWLPGSFLGLEAEKLIIHYHGRILKMEKAQCSFSLYKILTKGCLALDTLIVDSPVLSLSKGPSTHQPSPLEKAFSLPKHADKKDNCRLPYMFIHKWSIHNGRIVTPKNLRLNNIQAHGSLTPERLKGSFHIQRIRFHSFSLDNSIGHFQYQPCHKDSFHLEGNTTFLDKSIHVNSHRPYQSLEEIIEQVLPTLRPQDIKKHLTKELLHRVFESF